MSFKKGQYGYDLEWLQKFQTAVELVEGDSRVLVAPDLQGRVITSTTSGKLGYSFGWVNHDLLVNPKTSNQFNTHSGEERFWLGPAGGQFSLFFEKGKPMEIENWRVPQIIDTAPWDVQEVMPEMVTLNKKFSLKNYFGTEFQMDVTRRVGIILSDEIVFSLNCQPRASVKSVAYETLNQVKNVGKDAWIKEGGLPSIWMLSTYNPSSDLVIIVPLEAKADGGDLKSNYFGEIPTDRIKTGENFVLLKADGQYHSKLGITQGRAKRFLGSYDLESQRLTILETTINPYAKDYVNSSWDALAQEQFNGDLINVYNGDPSANGPQIGSFYELQTSSEALGLKPGESHIHIQRTYHFEGEVSELNAISETVLGVSLFNLKDAFN